MRFANRMDAFGTGIFSVLLQKKQEKEAKSGEKETSGSGL